MTWVEASLPKVLYGHNGRLIANQSWLNAGLAKLKLELSTVADVPDLASWRPWRVDLTWNFDLPARNYILAHFCSPVSGIRSLPILFDGGQGLSWRGARSHFMVKLYNKSRQMHTQGEVLRAEISLRSEQLTRRLDGDWRDFDALYRVYRKIMSSIPALEKPMKARGWQEAVGLETVEIRHRILSRVTPKSERTFRRNWSRMQAAQFPGSFAWDDALPQDNPPPAIHVE